MAETTTEVNFTLLTMKIPDIIQNYSIEQQKEIFDYLNKLLYIYNDIIITIIPFNIFYAVKISV